MRAYIGLGSNLGPRLQLLQDAATELAKLGRIRGSMVVGGPALDVGQPDYLNAVAALDTDFEPFALLGHLQRLEQRAGRDRSGPPRASRTLDLDLLWCGASIHAERLQAPHPRAHLRRFVLQPWAELAPDAMLQGQSVSMWLARLGGPALTAVAALC